MKSYIVTAAVFAALLLSVPAIPLAASDAKSFSADFRLPKDENSSEESSQEQAVTENKTEEKSDKESFKVLDITTGKVEEISAYDYIVGAVCAEMPATFETEALKAQAVAAHTYAVRQAEKAKLAPDKELCGADFSNDSSKYQAFFTESQAKQYYGDSYEQYISKIRNAVSEVSEEIIVYENEPIIAAFHSISTGKTESAENVWGSKVDYLVSVESEDDPKAPKYLEEITYSAEEVKEKLESAFDNINLDDSPESWFSDVKKSKSATVLEIKAGDLELTGQDIRAALSLRSAAFDIEYDNGFTITTRGYGHCVGMSQYGANEMAKDGKTYEEILLHYYPETSLKKQS